MSAESPKWSEENPEFEPGPAPKVPEPTRDRWPGLLDRSQLHPRSSRVRPLVPSRSRGIWEGRDRKGEQSD